MSEKETMTHISLGVSVSKPMEHTPTTTEIIEGAATALSGQWSKSWIDRLRALAPRMSEYEDALEFIGDHLESEMGLLSADDYDPEFGTNEGVILAFNKAQEALGSGRRVQVWND